MARRESTRWKLSGTPLQQSDELSNIIKKSTTEGINVAIAKPYEGNKVKDTMNFLFRSVRGYMEKQGSTGKKLSSMFLDARHTGDSLAGSSIVKVEKALEKLDDTEIQKFSYFVENGLEPDTLGLKKAIDVWREEANKVFTKAKEI